MPHAAHYICGYRCQFKLATKVGKYLISTVGEMARHDNRREFEEIGADRKYETYVFNSKKSEQKCCPWMPKSWEEIESEGYNSGEEAYKGHLKLCKKYSNQ